MTDNGNSKSAIALGQRDVPEWHIPRTWQQAETLAKMMVRLIPGAGGNHMMAMALLAYGAELGLSPFQSARYIDIIEGRLRPTAQLLVGLCLQAPQCLRFELQSVQVNWSDDVRQISGGATWVTKRRGQREITVTFTVEMARRAGLITARRFERGSNWKKWMEDMLVWRAASRLARQVYPDVCGGLYTPGELEVHEGPATEQPAQPRNITPQQESPKTLPHVELDELEPAFADGMKEGSRKAAIWMAQEMDIDPQHAMEILRKEWKESGGPKEPSALVKMAKSCAGWDEEEPEETGQPEKSIEEEPSDDLEGAARVLRLLGWQTGDPVTDIPGVGSQRSEELPGPIGRLLVELPSVEGAAQSAAVRGFITRARDKGKDWTAFVLSDLMAVRGATSDLADQAMAATEETLAATRSDRPSDTGWKMEFWLRSIEYVGNGQEQS